MPVESELLSGFQSLLLHLFITLALTSYFTSSAPLPRHNERTLLLKLSELTAVNLMLGAQLAVSTRSCCCPWPRLHVLSGPLGDTGPVC